MKSSFLDKLIDRLHLVDPGEVQSVIERLTRENGFMENVFSALREGMIILQPDGVITYVNPSACSLFGLQSEDTIGKPLERCVRGLTLTGLAKPDAVVSRDFEIFYPENRYLNFYISPIRSEVEEKETHLGYVLLVRDITETRQETAEAIETEKLNALTFLAAGVAHEIGNPLNSLNIHLQLLERKLKALPSADRTSLENHVQTARGEIQRLDGILRQFLQAIRPTPPERERMDLHDILEETLQLLQPELEARSVKIHLNLAPSLPSLQLDGDQIKQAFFNLIKNAFQALPASGGNIELKSEVTTYEIVFSISDDGPGISAEVMGTLFEPYRTTKSGGSGLGLLIVRRILHSHGGELEVESTEGEGTEVKLFFPLGEKPARLLANPDASPDEGSGNSVIEIDVSA